MTIEESKVGHTVLPVGAKIRAPKSKVQYVVVGRDEKGNLILGRISRFIHKDDTDLRDWIVTKTV